MLSVESGKGKEQVGEEWVTVYGTQKAHMVEECGGLEEERHHVGKARGTHKGWRGTKGLSHHCYPEPMGPMKETRENCGREGYDDMGLWW